MKRDMRYKLVVVALVALTFFSLPICGSAREQGGRASSWQTPADEGWPVIATIGEVGNDAHEIVEFTLDRCTAIRIIAVGEQNRAGVMQDYGAIEGVQTGQMIWQMYEFETDPTNRYPYRRLDRAISLPAGAYRLHYFTNGAISFEDWGDRPPEPAIWGITLYEDTEADAPVCWERASRPEDLGWSSTKLQQIVPDLEQLGVAAYLVVTDGKIVFEWGNTANNFFAHSMRKSLLSGLYGIYVAEGRIDLSKTLAELGIDDKVPLTDEEKQATVNDLLKARSGVYIPAAGEAPSMKDARPERHSHPRDTFWYYNNWDFNALGTIFDQETGEQNIYRAFTARIADPLGMQDWIVERLRYTYEPNSRHPYYGVRISARDLARFGQLFLQQGTWQGTEIVPAEWVEESTRVYSLTGSGGTYSGYGYMWWIAAEDASAGDYPPLPKGSYAASGYGGHTLEVLPEYNTVIVVRFNTDDPDVTLRGGFQVDMLVVKTLAAFSRAGNAHTWAWYLVLAWVVLAGASLLVLAVVLVWRRRREAVTTTSPRLVWPWVFVVMVLGPVGLLAYLVVHRQGAAVSC